MPSGTEGPRYGALDLIGWSANDGVELPQEVGMKRPNGFGLYDTLGNVWEWCWDLLDLACYGDYRVFRGGEFADEHWSVRASGWRTWDESPRCSPAIGARLLRHDASGARAVRQDRHRTRKHYRRASVRMDFTAVLTLSNTIRPWTSSGCVCDGSPAGSIIDHASTVELGGSTFRSRTVLRDSAKRLSEQRSERTPPKPCGPLSACLARDVLSICGTNGNGESGYFAHSLNTYDRGHYFSTLGHREQSPSASLGGLRCDARMASGKEATRICYCPAR